MAANDAERSSTTPRRQSVFKEVGLNDDTPSAPTETARPLRTLRFLSKPDIFEYSSSEQSDPEDKTDDKTRDTGEGASTKKKSAKLQKRMAVEKAARAGFEGNSTMYRFGAVALVFAILVPLLQGVPWVGHASAPPMGVNGGVIRREANPIIDTNLETLVRRADSPTDVCVRWAHQSALVNGTLYIYGGQASTSPGQEANTWNNDFLTLDLSSSWQISTPSLTGLPQPSGPPNVSLGALWNSYESLWLYGGEVSSDPAATPPDFALWEYNIGQSTWYEHSNPTTSAGQNSGADGVTVQRSAEGAGISVAALGRGWYFGGHQDAFTTPGWSVQIWRIYLQSLLEFTFPGFGNTQVNALSSGQTAGTDGNWRNITEGGTQSTAGFPERADGLLQYVPGFGANGILLGLAGGTNTTYQQMNEVDVFDIATSTWYKQATSGSTPDIRVNPCAVVAAAPDGSSYNLYMFGGQSLLPAGNQTQYNDMWILTMPAFQWIQVDQSSQSVPYARAGHTCNIWNAQMVVVGGYVGDQLSCDSPGVYVFDMSNLKWLEQYNALSNSSSGTTSTSASAPSSAADIEHGTSNSRNNPFNQQINQLANGTNAGGLEGSYGYLVPDAVQSVIGGASTGGATITAPAQTATAGPLKTGRPEVYTVTQSNGATVTETGSPNSNNGSSGTGHDTTNLAAIIAPSVIAAILFIIVCYLAFCAWLYKKRLRLYKHHLDMARASSESMPFTAAGAGVGPFRDASSEKPSSERRRLELAVSAAADSSSGRQGSGAGSGNGYDSLRRGSEGSAVDLMSGNEPTFWGTALAPRRSLRVINRD